MNLFGLSFLLYKDIQAGKELKKTVQVTTIKNSHLVLKN